MPVDGKEWALTEYVCTHLNDGGATWAIYCVGYVIKLSNVRAVDAGLQGVRIGLSAVSCLAEVGARAPCLGEAVCPLPMVFSQSSFQSRRAAFRMRCRACVRVTWFLCT